MDRLINAILRLSREGRRTLAPELLDLNALVRSIADTMQHPDRDRHALTIAPLPMLTSDRTALEQILSNLMENALKYLQPGPRRRSASAAAWRAGGRSSRWPTTGAASIRVITSASSIFSAVRACRTSRAKALVLRMFVRLPIALAA
jgi:signal transduction histidine kinase